MEHLSSILMKLNQYGPTRTECIDIVIQGFRKKGIAFNRIFSNIPTKNSIKVDTFFPEILYIIFINR